jgi:5-methylcytosine-specific restriction enzyme A
MPALTTCIDCSALVRSGPRCDVCRRKRVSQRSQQRGTRQQQGYDAEYQRNRALVIAAQPYCAACYRTDRLTADHIVPLSQGGTNDISNLRTYCIGCNSARARTKTRRR